MCFPAWKKKDGAHQTVLIAKAQRDQSRGFISPNSLDLGILVVLALWFKGLSSQAKIDENFANYFLKPKANNKCFIVLKCTYKGIQKSISELER